MKHLPLLAAFALLSAPAAAQQAERPLGEIMDVIEEELAAEPEVVPSSDPKLRTLPPAAPSPRIEVVDLPASDAEVLATGETDPEPAPISSSATDATAEALWEERLERKRAEVNALERPLVEQLNTAVASRVEAEQRAAEEAQAAHLQAVAERDEAIRRAQQEHEAALDRYRQQIAQQQADYEAQVRDCLRGVRGACAPRGE
jgi:hypothetical protein